ncbi:MULTISPECIES: cytochrome P450 [unclassified Mycobacterium]|uniref:cytochrome P450 n=1 Tax=unclassified Mycobacterium TaxID=2642494 RepID=UPI000AEA4FB5|nr:MULTISPECIES: cytochrome P450 [unclassified Mycobacterium]
MIHPEGDTVEEIEANVAVAGGKLIEYFLKFLAKRRNETDRKDDVIAVLLRSEVDGKPIEEPTC